MSKVVRFAGEHPGIEFSVKCTYCEDDFEKKMYRYMMTDCDKLVIVVRVRDHPVEGGELDALLEDMYETYQMRSYVQSRKQEHTFQERYVKMKELSMEGDRDGS